MKIDAPTSGQIPRLRRLWKQAFGDTEAFLDGFFATGFAPERCRVLWEQNMPLAALYWFDCLWQGRKVAYLYAIATEKAHRNQGLCRRLMEDTHRHLASLGYAGAVLVPAEDGLFRLYAKMGYHSFCPMTKQTVSAGTFPIPVTTLSSDQYRRERKTRLPENSILHGEATFAFFSRFAGYYAAGDCLFCGSREGEQFIFQEFLGSQEGVPGILAALGVRQGVFLSPGDRDCAMYCSFSQDSALPEYFGIFLD